jgi:hypothetical protein
MIFSRVCYAKTSVASAIAIGLIFTHRNGAAGDNGLPAPHLERVTLMASTNTARTTAARQAVTLAIGDKVPLDLSGEALALFNTLKEVETEAKEIKAQITAKCQVAGYVPENGGVLRFGRAAYSGEPTLYCFTAGKEKTAKPQRQRVHLA